MDIVNYLQEASEIAPSNTEGHPRCKPLSAHQSFHTHPSKLSIHIRGMSDTLHILVVLASNW